MLNLKSLRKSFAFVGIVGTIAFSTGSAFADTAWQQNHPRREQVNHRLARESARVHQEVKEGEMSKAKAARLHRQDHQIRKEERLMASQNGGHLTKQEQRTLNAQENKISRKIGG